MRVVFEFIQMIIETMLNILFVFTKSSFSNCSSFEPNTVNKKNIIVAMNGPSLYSDLEALPDKNCIYLGANHFADLNLFSEEKPLFYVFSDPYFWQEGVSDDLLLKRQVTYNRLVKDVTWDLVIYVPSKAALKVIAEQLKDNTLIKVVGFNGSGFPITKINRFINFLWSSAILSPFAQNVLIHSLYIAIMLEASSVHIVGANFSFHESIEVDQKTNEFYKMRKHAYGTQRELAYSDYSKTTLAKLSNEFNALSRAYRALECVSQFAKFKNVEIINYTKDSYLDMFKRP